MEESEKKSNNYYLTTTLPYVNADPHVGFALEIVHADIVVRYQRSLGKNVFFNTGTDEHGMKIFRKAQEEGKDVQQYVDEYASRFDQLKSLLDVSYTNFIRTTDPHHVQSAQEFWRRCESNGDIYKKEYRVKYCVGCELEKTDSELDAGVCPIHPSTPLEEISEENYFFRFSKYAVPLAQLYDSRPDFVLPATRQNEIVQFVRRGLNDFSISRVKEKMPWGIPVPGDESQVMYVWFDALVNYISAIGWPDRMDDFAQWWPVVQIAGKDNLRQQSAMWQAMLMSAGISPSEQIIIHGFITSGGQKMSKSVGNVINPAEIVAEYNALGEGIGTEALRYYLARELPPFEDGDFTLARFKDAYNANLANGLGNLASRIMKLASTHLEVPTGILTCTAPVEYADALVSHDIERAAETIWYMIGELDRTIQHEQPFKVIKEDVEKGRVMIRDLTRGLYGIACMLEPFLPKTAEKIKQAVRNNEMFESPLFPRKE